jgi:hypothetical protein
LKAVYDILVASAETIGAFNTGCLILSTYTGLPG